MMETYQKIIIAGLIIAGFYLFCTKKKDNFSKEYLELINSDEYKVKRSS